MSILVADCSSRSTTIKLNRPRTVNPAIITVSLPQANPALDDNQKFNNIEHQIADARLMLILDRVSEPSYVCPFLCC